jgi:hypothetical protein
VLFGLVAPASPILVLHKEDLQIALIGVIGEKDFMV